MGWDELVGMLSRVREVAITGLAMAGLCLPLGYCTGVKTERARSEAARALANAKALELDAHAGVAAAEDRVKDALTVERHEKELIDAIADIADDQPDRVRVALGCQRLRAQGTGEADLPAICRP